MVIGVTGKARSGKDTFAKMLANTIYEQTGIKFVLMAYAHELKLKIQKEFDLSYDQLWGDLKEEEDPRYKKPGTPQGAAVMYDDGRELPPWYWTPREIMQFYGTECMRAIDNNFWVRTLFNVVEEKGYEHIILTDVRFPNEADPVVERQGLVVRVTSDREELKNVHGQFHASETAMDYYDHIDFVVDNSGSLKDLQKKVEEIAQFILNKKLEA